MPIEEMVLTMTLVILGFAGTLGLASMFLSHRRRMAEIKYGSNAEDATKRENIELRETISLMQDRLAVLEQIAVDPAKRTAEEIEKLR